MKWKNWCGVALLILLMIVPEVFALEGYNAVSRDKESSVIAENNQEDVWGDSPSVETEGGGSSLWDEGGGEWEETESDSAESDRFEFDGLILLRTAVDIKEQNKFEDDGYGHGKLKLKTRYSPTDAIQVVLSVSGDYFLYANNNHFNNDETIRFDETYINFSNPRFNIKLGNQVVRWGKTDGYSPLDNLNPEDYRDGIAGRRENRKLPIPMANLELYQGTMTLQGIYIPFYYGPKFDLVGSDWAFFQHADQSIGDFEIREENPSKNLSNSEFGLRFSGIIRNLNYAASWFYTREDLPAPCSLYLPPGFALPSEKFSPLELAKFAVFTEQPINLDHDRQNIFGLELETTWHVFGVRADFAYSDDNSLLTNELKQVHKPALRTMAGIDYNSPNAWYANLQYAWNRILDYDDNILSSDETTDALIGTFRKDFSNGDLRLECRVSELTGDGTMLNPKFIMARWSPFKFEVGAEFFDGEVDTPMGFYSDNDQVYGVMELKF